MAFEHNKVDIYIKERNGNRKMRVPWLPEKINYSSGGSIVATYDIMEKGEVSVPTGAGLASISWEARWPGKNDMSSLRREGWLDPYWFHNMFDDWRKKGISLNLMVTGYPINKDVILKSYTAEASGGFGSMMYSCEFIEDRDITISSKKLEQEETKRPAQKTTSYTIKKGDTLWGIAKRFLGSGTKYTIIYEANKEIIEATARKYRKGKSSNNGWWIYPGVTIQIPQ